MSEEEQKKFTPEQVADKVEWEGGLWETAIDYGFEAGWIDDSTPLGAELKEAWASMQLSWQQHLRPAFLRVEDLLAQIEEMAAERAEVEKIAVVECKIDEGDW